MFKGFWLDNKQFLLMLGLGLGVFLLVNWLLIGKMLTTAGLTDAKCDTLRTRVQGLHADLAMDSHFVAKEKFDAYQDHEKKLATALCLPATLAVEGKSGELSIKFDQAIQKTWAALRQEANKAGIILPAALTRDEDFGVDQDDGAARYQEHYSYLSMVEKSLGLLINAGVNEIGTPIEIEPPERLDVNDNESTVCVYQRVSIPVTLSFASLQNVLDKAQEPAEPHLQVMLKNLDAKGSANEEERVLQGVIDFVGFRLAEKQQDDRPAGGGRPSGRRRRIR